MSKILSGPPLPVHCWNSMNQTMGNYILEYIRHNEDRVYMINGETNQQVTLHELSERSQNLAAHLQSLGCRSSQTNVAIYAENHINYMIAELGIWLSGSTVATLNYMFTVDELEHVISIIKPHVLMCSLSTYSLAKETQEKNDFIKHLVLLDDPPSSVSNVLLFSNLIEKSTTFELTQPSNDPNGPAKILFSSGTTGLPKGVLLTHRNILYIIHTFKIFDLLQLKDKFTLTTLPMFHGFGMFINLSTLTLDMTQIFLKRFDAPLYLSLIEKYKIQHLYLVPPIVVILLKNDLVDNYDVSSVNHVFCGAASFTCSTEKEIINRFRLKRFQQAYGMTETTGMVTLKRIENQKLGTCGTLLPGTMAKVVDPETGETLGPGQTGELCFKTPAMMKGYVDNPEATADMIRDGWLHTGDLGYYDDDGDFFVVDRLKELIKYNAYQVAPAELEALLIKHPEVKDAAVIGIPDEMAGQLPKAFVVRNGKSTISEEELQKYVADSVSPHKKLRGGVSFVDEIPKNQSGKILRRELRELGKANEIESRF